MRTVDPTLLSLVQAGQASRGLAFRFFISAVPGAVWCYTDIRRGVTLNSGESGAAEHYEPAAISVDKKEGDDVKLELTEFAITLPRLEPFLAFANPRLGLIVEVTVYEVWFDGSIPYPDCVADGHCTVIEPKAGEVKATFKPMQLWMVKQVPSIVYSTQDQRMPYGPGFPIDLESVSAEAIVTSLSQNVVYSDGAAKYPTGSYARGFVQYTRTLAGLEVPVRVPIVNNVAEAPSRFVMAYPPPHLAAGETFTAMQGYDGSYQSARAMGVYDDAIMFPWMPIKNPIFTGASL